MVSHWLNEATDGKFRVFGLEILFKIIKQNEIRQKVWTWKMMDPGMSLRIQKEKPAKERNCQK